MAGGRLFLGLVTFLVAAHGAQLALPSVQASPGQVVRIDLSFASQGSPVAALQVDLEVEPGWSVTAVLGEAGSAASKSLVTGNLAANKLRLLVFGMNQNSIADGAVVGLSITVGPGASAGVHPLLLSAAAGSDGSGTAVAIRTVDGSVSVGAVTGSPQFAAAGVVNAASYSGGGVAPGEIVTIFGAGLGPATFATYTTDASGRIATMVGDARVLFDGVPAPVVSARQDQISAQAPFSLIGSLSTQIQVEYRGVRSNAAALPVVRSALGIFAADGTGTGQAAVLNQDYTPNSADNPAAPGSVVMIYATGGGAVTPALQDGFVAGSSLSNLRETVTASIGGRIATVGYAGTAPGLLPGIVQINVQIPPDATPGAAVPISLTVNGQATQPGVTLAIAAR